jgi:hypothetical protein
MKTRISPILITFALVCFALLKNTGAGQSAAGWRLSRCGNTAEGTSALFSRTTGIYNTAIGYLSLLSDTEGQVNKAIGAGTLLSNTADNNTATVAAALLSNTPTGFNTANGAFALFSNTAGDANTAVGAQALSGNTTGSQNTAIGAVALGSNTTGRNNIAIGFESGSAVSIADSVICIGAGVVGDNVDDSCFIGNIVISTSPNGIAVLINSSGRLGTTTSSARFKDEIEPMDKASEALFALRPVAFRYKKDIDPAGTPQFGLMAEDVDKVNPNLIVSDKEGKPYNVRYDQVNAMLLNEFLKEDKAFVEQQRKLEQQGATIARQQKQIEALAAGLQKVSAQLELRKPAPQTVLNSQ